MAEFAPSAHDDYDFSAEVAADEEAFRREVEAASRDAGEDETVAPDDDGAPSTGPIVTLLIGMAGSGKTTLFHRLHYDCASSAAAATRNLDRRCSSAADFDHVIVDTPGQIEAFTWSASGQLIAESLASTFATNIVYADTPRTMGPPTLMSNMVDVQPCEACFEWMDDFEKFHEALDAAARDDPAGGSYVTSLHRSMSLVLDEFYRVLARVGVSAVSGAGIDALFDKITASRAIYDATYGAEINRRLAAAQAAREAKAAADLVRLEDVADVARSRRPRGPTSRLRKSVGDWGRYRIALVTTRRAPVDDVARGVGSEGAPGASSRT
ncbi:GTPase [Aureococcus anophagefferens]|nr:GTPase [Aureococcus anophagefferens]